MKSIVRNRHRPNSKPFDGKNYRYYDIEEKCMKNVTVDELAEYSSWLPQECKRICKKVKLMHITMSEKEQHNMLLLCSLSIYCWGGSPKCNMVGISMEDYANDFYIQMVHALSLETKSGWDPERSRWPKYVKWVRLKTIPKTISRWDVKKSGEEVRNFNALNKECQEDRGYDLESVILGVNKNEGSKVRNLNH